MQRHFVQGVETGLHTRFDDSGGKMEEGQVVDDLPEGRWRHWHPNGRLRTEGSYRAGVKVGTWPVWDKDGTVIDDGGLLPLPAGRGVIVLLAGRGDEELRYRLADGIGTACFIEDFSTGPLGADPASLPELRAGWWTRTLPAEHPPIQPPEWDEAWLEPLRRAAEADWAELWVGHSVREQILLAAVAGLCPDLPDLSVRVFAPVGRMPMMSGLWIEDIHPPLPEAMPVAAWSAIWPALTAPDPGALADLVRKGTGHAAMDRALAAMIDRYPAGANGLGSMDRRLLTQAGKEWRKVARVVGSAISDTETADTVGDQVLLQRLIELGSFDPPLVSFAGLPQTMRHSECRLTDFGMACLAGRARATAATGWTDRIGGVTLSAKNLWYREDLL